MTLRYLAKGDIYSEVSKIHGISRASTSKYLFEMVRAINVTLNNISFPTNNIQATKFDFAQMAGFPGVVAP